MYVLRAKQGDKDAFRRLWSMYNFVMEDLFEAICSVHKTVKYHKIDIFHNFYIFFWDIIMSYKFDDRYSFGYSLKSKIIEKSRIMLRDQYDIYEGNIVDNRFLLDFKRKKPGLPHRIRVKRTIKSLTAKQKEYIFLNYFVGISMEECRNLLAITGTSLETRSFWARKKFRSELNYKGKTVRGKERKEKVYRVYQRKITEKNNES